MSDEEFHIEDDGFSFLCSAVTEEARKEGKTHEGEVAVWLRLFKKREDLDPRFREAVRSQEFFQDLESWEPRFRSMPLRASEIFGFLVPKGRIP